MRVDHVGSLLRPEGLKAALLRFGQGRLSEEGLRMAQDHATRDVVAKQQAHGVPVVTDGEYRRLNWQVSFSRVKEWDQGRDRVCQMCDLEGRNRLEIAFQP